MKPEPMTTSNGAGKRSASHNGEPRQAGVVLTDVSLTPIAIDSGAVTILGDAKKRNGGTTSAWSIPPEIVDALRDLPHQERSGLRIPFWGAEYEYHCTVYQIEPHGGVLNQPLVTLYLHRDASARNAICSIAAERGLTPREEEVMACICSGLTSKDVARRMKISPNTVKTYLRSIMLKLGVTTRAGIVGKLLEGDADDNHSHLPA